MVGTNQFTPQQILEAGRRAEADGKIDYAVQFYRHITAHHGGSTEAAIAADALRRLESSHRDPQFQPAPPTPDRQYLNGQTPPAAYAPAQAPAPVNGHWQGRPATTANQRPPSPSPDPPSRRQPAETTNSRHNGRTKRRDHTDEPTARTPEPPASGYRLGRALAALLLVSGAIATIAGCISLAASAAVWFSKPAASPVAWLATSPILAGSLVTVALVFLLMGYMARAVFDIADATANTAGEHDAD